MTRARKKNVSAADADGNLDSARDVEIERSATELDIHRICDDLNAEGEKPSYKAIRERRGSGSWSTIQKYMNTWIAREIDSPVELPGDLERLSISVGRQLWARALTMAGRQHEEAKARWRDREAELMLAITHAEGDTERAEAQADAAEKDAAASRGRIGDLEAEVERLSIRAAEMTGELSPMRQLVEALGAERPDVASKIARLYPKESA